MYLTFVVKQKKVGQLLNKTCWHTSINLLCSCSKTCSQLCNFSILRCSTVSCFSFNRLGESSVYSVGKTKKKYERSRNRVYCYAFIYLFDVHVFFFSKGYPLHDDREYTVIHNTCHPSTRFYTFWTSFTQPPICYV